LKPYKPKIGERILNSIGEAPVFIDTAKIANTTKQIQVYLVKKGYFNAEVIDTIIKHKNKPKASVYYIINKHKPYRIHTITRRIPNHEIAQLIHQTTAKNPVIKNTQIFDVEKLKKERNNIEKRLLNEGYYGFSKDYIYYEIDSVLWDPFVHKPISGDTIKQNQDGYGNLSLLAKNNTDGWVKDSTKLLQMVNITMGVQQLERKNHLDSIVNVPHQKYQINKVTVFADYSNTKGTLVTNYDSLIYSNNGKVLVFAYQDRIKVRSSIIANRIFILPGNLYRAKDVEATYKQLSDLGVFRLVSVKFNKTNEIKDGLALLECVITLTQSKRQSFTLETDGTNRGGNLGIEGSISYNHKNLFKGAEKLSISMSGGLEVQQLFTNQDSTLGSSGLNPIFNTVEFGPSISLDIPKAILIQPLLKQWDHTSTGIQVGLNYQQRPDFTRNTEEGHLKWDFSKGSNHFNTGYNLSALKISKQSQEFKDRLAELNDPILNNSFIDHIISSLSFGYTYNDQSPNKLKNVGYYSASVELAGFFLRKFAVPLGLDYNAINDSYSIFGTRFAEYVRTTQDLRFYQRFNEKSEMVYRFIGGIGVPFENIKDALPFERSFFAGGANSIRGWRARLLGPGGHLDTTFQDRFDKIGDIYLETNLEYRFDLFDFIEGAIFLDAGNIWLINESVARPGGFFTKDFYKEIAVSSGVGFRFDLDFFIVRLDIATRIKDPALPVGERWFFQDKTTHNILRQDLGADDYKMGINLNFGIGYPF